MLPVTPPEQQATGVPRDYHARAVRRRRFSKQLLPLYVRNAVYRALVETAAGEQGARRTAMKNATDNAGDMLDVLQADVQPRPPGADHAGNRRDRRRCGGAVDEQRSQYDHMHVSHSTTRHDGYT